MGVEFDARTEKSLAKLFNDYSRPVKLKYTKTIQGVDIAHPSTIEVLEIIIDAFFINSETSIEEKGVVVVYDGELIVNDLNFNPNTVSFSKGIYIDIQGLELIVNGITVDTSEITDIDTLLVELNKIDNITTIKTSDIEFYILSTIDDFQNDLDYKNLAISGQAQIDLGLSENSTKSALSLKINNVAYTVGNIYTGDFIKILKLKRG